MNDQHGRYARLGYTAVGALAALVVVGVIAGAAALAAQPGAKTRAHAAAAAIKKPASGVPAKGESQEPGPAPILAAVQRLVNDGTISSAQAQIVDRQIQAGSVDPQALAAAGFSQAQVHAVEQALINAKRALSNSSGQMAASAARRHPQHRARAAGCTSRRSPTRSAH